MIKHLLTFNEELSLQVATGQQLSCEKLKAKESNFMNLYKLAESLQGKSSIYVSTIKIFFNSFLKALAPWAGEMVQ